MDSNTQKGCMIGCLSSVGIFIGFVALVIALSALTFRGCAQAISLQGGNGAEIASLDGELKPQDEKPFRKVWLSGRGGAKSAHVLKIRLHGIIASSFERNVFRIVQPRTRARRRPSARSAPRRGTSPSAGYTWTSTLPAAA